eukprot:TRINITY_DN502_c0_g6_i2.p2 TRINITY_DN502_c0_g6~~TRINITY_DN502_c0_g6_i2.p2  ORF type:complete len:105 (-),score=28.21 TRINITY_DN502_c0_g6_i2:26-340(-)
MGEMDDEFGGNDLLASSSSDDEGDDDVQLKTPASKSKSTPASDGPVSFKKKKGASRTAQDLLESSDEEESEDNDPTPKAKKFKAKAISDDNTKWLKRKRADVCI